MRSYVIDGSQFKNLDEFFVEVSAALMLTVPCKSIDSFNDILRGQYDTLEREFILIWTNIEVSRASLGYVPTIAWLQDGLRHHARGLTYLELLQQEYAYIKNSYPDQDEAFHLER